MTSNLYITSLEAGTGKTTFTLSLARKFKQKGHNVGYFKPITDNVDDSDALNAKELLQMDDELQLINPVMISSFEYDMTKAQKKENLDKIISAYNTLMEKYDFLVIESCRTINYLSFIHFSVPDLVTHFNAKVLILASGKTTQDADSLIMMKQYLDAKSIETIGGIFTLVPVEFFDHMNTVICPQLKKTHKIRTFGMVPDHSQLVAPTVSEIASVLDAKFIAGKAYGDKLVENYMIGAMNPETALKYFRRSINKAVITGGDRPQLAIAAMETDTSVLILTGSILPPASVLARAEERKIAILSVPGDTFGTIKTLTSQQLYGHIHKDHVDRVQAWDTVLEDVDYSDILKLIME